jgi:hypothetical protein
MPILINKTIRLFLDSIGKRDEYQYYLKRFQASRSAAFALLCPDRLGFEQAAEVLAFDLDFLLKLEIFPAILLCGSDAGEMREILTARGGRFAEMDLSGRVLNRWVLAEVADFLKKCRKEHALGILINSGLTCAETLPNLVPAISKRIHFLRLSGPLHSREGQALMNYNYRRPDRPALADEDIGLAGTAERLLEMYPDLHISIASPLKILEELFTVKGAGCLVRRGSVIRKIEDPAELDFERLSQLMFSSFGRQIKESSLRRAELAFVEENYRGVALLERHNDTWYLSKFAVETAARGEGLAAEIWDDMIAADPPVFWRARAANPINHWYSRHADGSHRAGEWIIYWRNIDWRELAGIIEYALGRSDDFR